MKFNNLKQNSSILNSKFKKLNSLPKKKLMIITCMDTRINPYDIFNLKVMLTFSEMLWQVTPIF